MRERNTNPIELEEEALSRIFGLASADTCKENSECAEYEKKTFENFLNRIFYPKIDLSQQQNAFAVP